MSHRHAICLVVDGLRASALGTYGNTIYPTPQFDRLASQALVFDWLWADSPSLSQFYRSVWHGAHALRPAVAKERWSVLDQLRQSGVRQCLVTDDSWLGEQAGRLPLDEVLVFENGAQQAATLLGETVLGRFFAAAIDRLHQWREDLEDASSLIWLHCRGFMGPWDAPLELRAALLDDEDPPPPEFVDPPAALRSIDDPDVLLANRVAYAAQVAVLDACVGAFVQAIDAVFEGTETLISLVGSRGLALGEHGSIGTDCAELFSERLHLPWLLVPCGKTTALSRLTSLAQPADVGATLLEWLGAPNMAERADGISYRPLLTTDPLPTEALYSARQLVVAAGAKHERAIRTPAWMLRQSATDIRAAEQALDQAEELYTKPDDRWECNDIGGLCPAVVQQLCKELADFEQCGREGRPLPLVPREHELIVSSR